MADYIYKIIELHLKSTKSYEKKVRNEFENNYIEILGIKLYFDDLLIICLILCLYNEGVKDQFLFIQIN